MCERFGIPHSRFLGGDGSWSALDREKALAWREWQRWSCGECGTRPDDWDPGRGGHRDAYIADTVRCPGCERIAQERDLVPDGRPGYGVKVALLPRAAYELLHLDDAPSRQG